MAPPVPPPLDSEYRSKRRLAQCHHSTCADSAESHRQSDRSRRFPSPNGVGLIAVTKMYFLSACLSADPAPGEPPSLVSSIGMQFIRGETESFGNVLDGERAVRSAISRSVMGLVRWKVRPVPSIPRHPCADRTKNTRYVRRPARNQACRKNHLVENVFRRIKCLAVHLDHVMKMRAGGEAAASYQSHHRRASHAALPSQEPWPDVRRASRYQIHDRV